MKLLSIVVCCYNSQEYMATAIESLLKGGEDVEIIIVDDGSKDDTGKIADEYVAKYPTICKVVHQPNGGHGAGVQSGIREATGQFFKIVDSDDWVDDEAYQRMLAEIREKGDKVDLFVNDYTYYPDKVKGTTIGFGHRMPADQIITWKQVKRFNFSQNLLIHSCMFRTQVLKDSDLHIPVHTFYEDDYCVYAPLRNVKNICYVPVSLYCYYVGRAGQSVQKDVAVRRYRDYLKVAMACIKEYNIYDYLNDKAHFRMLYHEIRIFISLGFLHTQLNKSKEARADLKAFFKEFKQANPRLYRRIRFSLIGPQVWPIFGRMNSAITYSISHLIVKFN